MSDLKKALEAANITVRKYDTTKVRPVYTHKTSLSVSKFTEELVNALGTNLLQHQKIVAAINAPAVMEKLLEEYAEDEGLVDATGTTGFAIPNEISHLTLNVDKSSKELGMKRYFCTTKEELVDTLTSGQFFIEKCMMRPGEQVSIARAVVPKYLPRSARGVHEVIDPITTTTHSLFNMYIPPEWQLWKERNPKAWNKIPAKPPADIIKFLRHFIPIKEEREYLYAWMYTSITSRSYVYLVLQGAPGVGKNRLRLLLNALHGKTNAVAGKKETFGANDNKFNSQMENNTLSWFDELKYGPDMEPRMKEYQNSDISIERKGVDATSRTEIYSSMVISNNYPRDNYLLFNSRKFAPLVLGEKPLTASMTDEEIGRMSDKMDLSQPHTFDVKYVAQIAKWILAIGPKYVSKFPNLEYQGPKFWELAHSSMSRWQKIAVMSLTTQNARGMFPGWDAARGAFLWSKVEEALRRKKEYESKDYRDSSTVKAFFSTYCDEKGVKVFETEDVPGSIVQDFWIKIIAGPKSTSQKSSDAETVSKESYTTESKHLTRPKGITDFRWRKMKEEHEAIMNGGLSGKEKDDL